MGVQLAPNEVQVKCKLYLHFMIATVRGYTGLSSVCKITMTISYLKHVYICIVGHVLHGVDELCDNDYDYLCNSRSASVAYTDQ